MDQRLHIRFLADAEVCITPLAKADRSILGQVQDISVSGLRMALPCQLTPGDLVKLVIADSTLFGYVVYSNSDGACFQTGVEIQRVLLGGTDLSGLLRKTLQETMPDVAGVAAGD